MAMDSPWATASSGGLPHSDIRGSTGARPSPRLFAACHVLHRLSVPRHSPDALIVPRPRPTPSTPPQPSCGRCQRSDVRDQRPSEPSLRPEPVMPRPIRLRRLTLHSGRARTPPRRCSRSGLHAPPMLAHRQRIPMPRPDLTPPPKRMAMMAGPASRSRLASRCHKNRGQRTDDRPDGPSRPFSVTTRGPDARRRAQRLSVLCSLSSVICTWWAWADLNGRPHAYQACALTN